MFALFYSSLRFTEGGREGGTDLPIQNYMDIDEISIRKQNLSRNEASPSRFTGGGARGWVPIEGARIFQFLKVKEQNLPQGKILLLPNGRQDAARLKHGECFDLCGGRLKALP